MGLDGVELVMEVEDHFRLSLRNEDCERAVTVGDLAALVVRELSKVARVCPTAKSFFGLRRSAATITRLGRGVLRPGTPLDQVVPRSGRRRRWRQLRSANPVVPPLVPSARVSSVLSATCRVLCVAWFLGTSLLVVLHGFLGIALGLGLGLALGLVCTWTSDRLSTEFPNGCASLGDLARRITCRPLPHDDPRAERRVLDAIRVITSEQTGIPVEDVKPESRFVDDLGMD